jgi:hypothetical protein
MVAGINDPTIYKGGTFTISCTNKQSINPYQDLEDLMHSLSSVSS